MELHAAGPAKLFDTAGIDESGALGDKKRRKVLSVLKVRLEVARGHLYLRFAMQGRNSALSPQGVLLDGKKG